MPGYGERTGDGALRGDVGDAVAGGDGRTVACRKGDAFEISVDGVDGFDEAMTWTGDIGNDGIMGWYNNDTLD